MADDQGSERKAPDWEAIIRGAVEAPEVPKIYANGFSAALSNADVIIVFQRFGPKPVAVMNLWYTLAKTLAQRLGTLVSEFENNIAGQEILTTDRIDKAIGQAKEKELTRATQKAKSDDVH